MDTENGTECIRYAVTDIQGSVTEVYDEDNRLLWKSGYTAFGIKAGETTKLIDFDGLYTDCDIDAETGLTYHWNRWRGEDGSNWLSEDPARDGLNWYGYAGQNPMKYIDPNGLAPYVNGIYDGPYNPDFTPEDKPTEFGPQLPAYPTDNSTSTSSSGGGGPSGNPEPLKAPDSPKSSIDILGLGATLFDFKDGLKKGIGSLTIFVIDEVLGKVANKDINGDYVGSLYFQQYVNQVQLHNELDGLSTMLSFVLLPAFSGALSTLGLLSNFESRDGQIVAINITGFIKGAQMEIDSIDSLLNISNDIEYNDFLSGQKEKLKFELNYNKNHFLNNYAFKDLNGTFVEVDKNQYINNSKPLPGIDYQNSIYKNKRKINERKN